MMPFAMISDMSAPAATRAGAAAGATDEAADEDLHGFASVLAGLDPLLLQALAGAVRVSADGQAGALRPGGEGSPLPAGGNALPLPEGLRGALLTALERQVAQPRALEPLAPERLTSQLGADRGERGERAAGLLTAGLSADGETAQVPAGGASGASARAPLTAPAPSAGALPSAGAGAPPLPLGQPQFDRMLGQRLMTMVVTGAQHARVHVHPEHLGPIDVRLRLDGEAMQLTFSSPHAVVRETLEQALPRLREALADAGVALTQADVGEGEGHAARHGDGDGAGEGAGREGGEAEGENAPASRPLRSDALIDTFA